MQTPPAIIFAIAQAREYGCKKYGDPENWRRVEPERYKETAFRHFLAYVENSESKDEESGLPHLYHAACNLAFLIALEKQKKKNAALEEIIDNLKEQREDRERSIAEDEKDDPDNIFAEDVKALSATIEILEALQERAGMIYTSRFANPALKSGAYTAVRISIGAPRCTFASQRKNRSCTGIRWKR